MIRKLTAVALATLFTAGAAHAVDGEMSPNPPAPFQSTLSRAQVQAEARNAPTPNNGSTGVLQVRGNTDRAMVQAGARATAREGCANCAEVGTL
ncbi:DUF4148 domain-containing protein [uncultured Pseudacidovorax sp.]|uniref:DUF4148 domain-containing protein n=1 Tax=uncultured Pseudacidovorax sp. TaxID=679313 RepID=UPI0025D5C313|nr:DUF4148 domain-containing protein [uncultured Pseudacidovorax sp.]